MRLLPLTLGGKKEKVMVPICSSQRWVTVCNGVNKSNINFSENTPTVCQAPENLNMLKDWCEVCVTRHAQGVKVQEEKCVEYGNSFHLEPYFINHAEGPGETEGNYSSKPQLRCTNHSCMLLIECYSCVKYSANTTA